MADVELELMEVDEDSSGLTSGTKRSFTGNVVRPSKTSSKAPIQRTCVRARRLLRSKPSSSIQALYCVLDTNVLIDHMFTLKRLVSKSKTYNHAVKQFIVPWVVLQELDGLKNNKEISKSVTNIIKFLNEQLKLDDGLLRGEQIMNKAPKNKYSPDVVDNNDDKVLSCCLDLISGKSANEKVILITSDVNLQNKALVHQVQTMTMNDLVKTHFDKMETSTPLSNVEDDEEGTTSNCHKYRRTESGQAIPVTRPEAMKTTIPSKSSSSAKNLSKLVPSKNCSEQDSSFIALKYELEAILIEFIVTKLCQIYGKDGWKDVVPHFDPKNASLVDCLRLVKKLWIGVFSDHFNRSQSVLKQIDELLTHLNQNNSKKAASLMQVFCKLLGPSNSKR